MVQTNSLRVSFLGFLKLLMVVTVLCWRTRSASSQRLLGKPKSMHNYYDTSNTANHLHMVHCKKSNEGKAMYMYNTWRMSM